MPYKRSPKNAEFHESKKVKVQKSEEDQHEFLDAVLEVALEKGYRNIAKMMILKKNLL